MLGKPVGRRIQGIQGGRLPKNCVLEWRFRPHLLSLAIDHAGPDFSMTVSSISVVLFLGLLVMAPVYQAVAEGKRVHVLMSMQCCIACPPLALQASMKYTAVTRLEFVQWMNAQLPRVLSYGTGGTAKPMTDVRFVVPADQVGPPPACH